MPTTITCNVHASYKCILASMRQWHLACIILSSIDLYTRRDSSTICRRTSTECLKHESAICHMPIAHSRSQWGPYDLSVSFRVRAPYISPLKHSPLEPNFSETHLTKFRLSADVGLQLGEGTKYLSTVDQWNLRI